MEKAKCRNYRGIQFVQITDLPREQAELFKEWLPETEWIKIQTEEEVLERCAQYRFYEEWYLKYFHHNGSAAVA